MTSPDVTRAAGGKQAPPSSDAIPEQLAQIQELQRETLALLRQIAEMLIPKSDPDKPRLEDLIAALVGQQTGMLALLKQIAEGVADVRDHLPGGDGVNGRRLHPNGGLRQ